MIRERVSYPMTNHQHDHLNNVLHLVLQKRETLLRPWPCFGRISEGENVFFSREMK